MNTPEIITDNIYCFDSACEADLTLTVSLMARATIRIVKNDVAALIEKIAQKPGGRSLVDPRTKKKLELFQSEGLNEIFEIKCKCRKKYKFTVNTLTGVVYLQEAPMVSEVDKSPSCIVSEDILVGPTYLQQTEKLVDVRQPFPLVFVPDMLFIARYPAGDSL